MKTGKQSSWGKLFLSMGLAAGLVILLLITLTTLTAVAGGNNPASNIVNGDSSSITLNSTGVFTNHLYLPVITKRCLYQSTREPLEDTGGFPGEIEITAPEHCTTGYSTETGVLVGGTFAELPPNTTLWVLAYAEDFLYYAQSSDACAGEPPLQQGGFWQVLAFLGLAGGDPEWFDIVVVLADEDASQFLSEKLMNDCMIGNYTGMPAAQLEQLSLSEKNFISVQTTD